ncbi:MAG: hypothetical protein RL701_6996, partial [Pseudomonadota bacterium]
ELRGSDHTRTVSLAPGRYFIRARTEHVLYEGVIETVAGASLVIELQALQRIEYAKLVRKGGSAQTLAQRLDLWLAVRSPLINASGPCLGAGLGYGVDLQPLSLHMRVSACTSSFSNAELRGSTSGYTAELDAYHAWDFSVMTLALGLGAGTTLFTQRFVTTRMALDRTSLVPFVSVGLGAEIELSSRLFAALQVSGQTYFMTTQLQHSEPRHAAVSFAVDSALGLGVRF